MLCWGEGLSRTRRVSPPQVAGAMHAETTATELAHTDNQQAEEFPYVPELTRNQLTHRQLVDYNEHRRSLLTWLETQGKNPEKHTGYSDDTVYNYSYRLDRFYRWVWAEYDGYTIRIQQEYADAYIDALYKDELRKDDGETYSGNHKRKTANAIETLFNWKACERDGDRWSADVSFSEQTVSQADPFSKDERKRLREAALELDTIPGYNDRTPDERDRWKAYIAQKLGKPKDEVSPDDWKRINRSWGLPSLVLVALDTGLRPVGIEKMNTGWLRLEKGVIAVPPKKTVKDGDPTEIALTQRTVNSLRRWLEERENYEKYDETDAVWLNRKKNRYNSDTLNYLLDKLCDEAGITQENRNISWYSIRRSVGTYLISEGSLAEAQTQLRHKNPESTMRYAESPPEERRNTLDKI